MELRVATPVHPGGKLARHPGLARAAALSCLLLVTACSCSEESSDEGERGGATARTKTLSLALRSASPTTIDPAASTDAYQNQLGSLVYEPLLQYRYGVEPLELEPLLLEEMPTVSEDGRELRLRLKPGVRFHDDPCFEGGVGREMVAADVVHSLKRLADPRAAATLGWSYLKDCIVGLDAYHEACLASEEHDREAAVEGLRVVDAHTVLVRLNEPRAHFLSLLARFQLSIVPPEAVAHHGARLARHPVGTGPYTLAEGDWTENSVRFLANPDYHGSTEARPLPRVPELRYTFYSEDAPLWLEYRQAGGLDFVQVPKDQLEVVLVPRTGTLKAEFRDEGHRLHRLTLLESIHFGIDMDDEVLGGREPERVKLRQALSLAADLQEINEVIYKGQATVYDGIVPPGLAGATAADGTPSPVRGPDLDRARALITEAGFPGGEGLPALEVCHSDHPSVRQQVELLARQWERIGVQVKARPTPFPTLKEWMAKGDAPIFAYGWLADYPDAEAQLRYFYGGNVPGINATRYRNPAFDSLYESLRLREPGPARAAAGEELQRLLLADCPLIGSLARTRFYLARPWVQDFHPTEAHHGWLKYVDVDTLAREP